METTNKYIRHIATKRMAEDDAVNTELTLDCSDLTPRDFVEYALQSLVIKWQGNARRNALKAENAVPIPKTATWRVPKPGVKTVMSIEQAIMSLTKERKAELLKLLAAQMEETDEE
jgi:hypothetical protein